MSRQLVITYYADRDMLGLVSDERKDITPWDAPFIPPFPMTFRNAEILTAFWRTDPAAMAFLAPPPVEPLGDIVCVHVYKRTTPTGSVPIARRM